MIALKIGDESFAEACKDLSSIQREMTYFLLEAGFEYGDRAYKLEDLPRLFPQTVAALKP